MKFRPYEKLYLSEPLTSETVDALGIYSLISEDEVKYYKYRFPVYYWIKEDGTKVATLYGVFTINMLDSSVRVDVKTLLEQPYAYFYNTPIDEVDKFGHPILYTIHRRLHLKLKNLGIKRKKEYKDNKDENSKTHKKVRNTSNDKGRIQKERKSSPRHTSGTKELSERRNGKRNNRPGKPDRKVLQKNKHRRPQDGIS